MGNTRTSAAASENCVGMAAVHVVGRDVIEIYRVFADGRIEHLRKWAERDFDEPGGRIIRSSRTVVAE